MSSVAADKRRFHLSSSAIRRLTASRAKPSKVAHRISHQRSPIASAIKGRPSREVAHRTTFYSFLGCVAHRARSPIASRLLMYGPAVRPGRPSHRDGVTRKPWLESGRYLTVSKGVSKRGVLVLYLTVSKGHSASASRRRRDGRGRHTEPCHGLLGRRELRGSPLYRV